MDKLSRSRPRPGPHVPNKINDSTAILKTNLRKAPVWNTAATPAPTRRESASTTGAKSSSSPSFNSAWTVYLLSWSTERKSMSSTTTRLSTTSFARPSTNVAPTTASMITTTHTTLSTPVLSSTIVSTPKSFRAWKNTPRPSISMDSSPSPQSWRHSGQRRKQPLGTTSLTFIFAGATEPFDETERMHPLRRAKVWGCPAYVLDPTIRDGGKIPKWQPRSRRGKFVGLSSKHASTVGNILNLKTGFISPQFHVVYDNWFQTVSSTEEVVPECWGKLVETERDNLLIDLYEEMRLDPGSHFQEPELADEWLIQEWKEHGLLVLDHVKGTINPSDALTKALGWVLHRRHCTRLMGLAGSPYTTTYGKI